MPDEYRKFLLKMVEVSRKENRMSFCCAVSSGGVDMFEFPSYEWPSLDHSPFEGYAALGLACMIDERHCVLTAKAYEWADYQRKGCVCRWFIRRNFRDWILLVSFVLTLALTVLQIIEALGYKIELWRGL